MTEAGKRRIETHSLDPGGVGAFRRRCQGSAEPARREETDVTFGSLFTGIAGFDLGLTRAGFRCEWQVEFAKNPAKVLDQHYPDVRRHGDIHSFPPSEPKGWHVDLIAGGDPCPYRSRARSIHGTDSPDLWPEFLRVVRALRPLWVLRENVVSPDIDDCYRDLCDLGYEAIVLETDGSQVTGQSRSREYLCGVLGTAGICPGQVFSEPECDGGDLEAVPQAWPIAQCLTTHPRRFDSRDNYIFESGRGARILSPVERERLQGFPDGWTAGLSDWQRAHAVGNALIPAFPEWIGRRIIAAHERPEEKSTRTRTQPSIAGSKFDNPMSDGGLSHA